MAGTTLAQGANATLTLAATDSVLIDSAAGTQAVFEAVSGVAGSDNKQVLAYHPGGRRVYGPFGAGSVKLTAIIGALTYIQGPAPLAGDGGTIYISAADMASNANALQAAHDALKSAGGGHIELEAGAAYAPTLPLSVDASFVGIRFNGAYLDISAIGSGNTWLTVWSSKAPNGSDPGAVNREFSGAWIYGGGSTGGVTAIRFNSDVASSAVRIVCRNMRFRGLGKGVSFGSRSYFVFFYDSYFHNCAIAVYQSSSPTSFAEKNSFTNCVFADNDTHFDDRGGNVWKLISCSLDYHKVQLCYLTSGASINMVDCHLEWDYGETAGQTTPPIQLVGPNCSFTMNGGAIWYAGASKNPYYTSIVSLNNSAQFVDVRLDKAAYLGRVGNTTSLDCFSYASSLVFPYVRLRANSLGQSSADLPSMTHYAEDGTGAGQGGLLRNGLDNPNSELAHRIGVTGSSAVAHVASSENGVTIKNSSGMLKLTGTGKVLISFPVFEPLRRHVWSFFTNPAYMTGSVTIKERVTGFGTKFTGTTITPTADTRGAVYGNTTITVSAGADAWTRRSWRDANAGFTPSARQSMATVVIIEIDMASMSAGALYLSHFAYDVM